MVDNNEFREKLISRNLYVPDNAYPIDNPSNVTKIVNSIESVTSQLFPFRGIPISDSLLGRTLIDKTPIVEIGLMALMDQVGKGVKSGLISDYMPDINVNLLPSSREGGHNFIEIIKKEDWNITSKQEDIGILNAFEKIFNYTPNNIHFKSAKGNPKRPNIKHNYGETLILEDVLSRTGKGQIFTLNTQLNENLYRSDFYINNSSVNKYFNLNSRDNLLQLQQKYSFDSKFNPYNYYLTDLADIDEINKEYNRTNKNVEFNEYGQSIEFIDNLGEPIRVANNSQIEVNDIQYPMDESSMFVWNTENNLETYNIGDGLLKYTHGLVKATKGKLIESDKNVFIYDIDRFGYNGSRYRQNRIGDQYNNYQKAVRWEGNGIENSVVKDTVMPKIHPNYIGKDNDEKWKQNMMFSIENLAYNVEDGTTDFLPEYEVGPFKGRLMWFPPYDIQMNETSRSDHQTTNFIGRNEPIYSYTGSERLANINFKMLVDYPQIINNFSDRRSSTFSEFFAFGDNAPNIDPKQKQQDKIPETLIIEDELPIGNIETDEQPDEITMGKQYILSSFINDLPTEGLIYSIFDTMFQLGYEVRRDVKPKEDKNTFGLNSDIFSKEEGVHIESINDPEYSYKIKDGFPSQYTDTGDNTLNNELRKFFSDPKNRKYYNIEIDTGASKLHNAEYNQKLSERRLEASKFFIEQRLVSLFPTEFNLDEITITPNAFGEELASSDLGNSPDNLSLEEVKRDRFVKIRIVRNGNEPEKSDRNLNANEQETYRSVERLTLNNYESNSERDNLTNNPYGVHFAKVEVTDDGELKGFGVLREYRYKPVFHSQTPEDFHRRLTFLQQCMRQGNPIGGNYGTPNDTFNNSVFGRQPICVLRIGDFFYTKMVLETLTFDYRDATWDFNPEGFGAQPMIVDVTMQLKVIGGQSLKGPINALQNATSYNHYANSTYSPFNIDVYKQAKEAENKQFKS